MAPRGPLRIAIDATPLLGEPTGIGGFVRSLLDADRTPERYTAYALSGKNADQLPQVLRNAKVKVSTRKMPASLLLKRWASSDFPRLEHFGIKADVVHGTNFVVPPSKAAAVVTVHDLTCVRYPEMVSAESLRYPALIQRAIDNGAIVHTPTEAIADEVLEHFDVAENRVRAIHHGLHGSTSANAPLTDITLGNPYILAVGTLEPRKDYPTLIKAFDKVASVNPKLLLIIVGQRGWGAEAIDEAMRNSIYSARIRITGYKDEATKSALMRGAKAFAFPSIYEGFGLPPLEAMQAGVPVVASKIAAVEEVCGNAALLTPVGNAEVLAQALHAAVNDDSVRTDAISRGIDRAQRFQWPITSRRMISLYEEAAALKQ